MPRTEYLPSRRLRLVAVECGDVPREPRVPTRIRVLGPWTDRTAAIVARQIGDHAKDGRSIVVDLDECPNPSTSQLAVLIAGLRLTREAGAVMVIDATPDLRQLASICRVDHLLSWRT